MATAKPAMTGGQPSVEKSGVGPQRGAAERDLVDVINQVFAELELAYHNQFHKAFGQGGALGLAKKYWLGVLREYRPEVILRAVRQVVRNSEFLPSLAAIVRACENAHELFGLPTAQAAYVEACCAAEPKAEQRWTHPAVYLAGEACGWFQLASEPQSRVFPLFDYHYARLCQAVVRGEALSVPRLQALPEKVEVLLSPEENLARLQALKQRFDL
ncbi:MAG TPA: hypothetical protein GX696_11655 [Pseudomonadaceae bacterium]|nr:hypothetical protein [Pseudomonadaceae bacterium]